MSQVKMEFYLLLNVHMHSVLRARLPLEGGILWIRLGQGEISVHLMQIIHFKFNIYIFFKLSINISIS